MQAITRIFVSLILFALISGCSTAHKAFQESAEGSTASVTFVSKSDLFNLAVIHLPGKHSSCSCSTEEAEIIGIFNNKATLMAGGSNYADKGKSVDRFTVKIDANGEDFRFLIPIPDHKFTSIGTNIAGTLSYCQVHHSFTPQAGESYIITYDPNISMCSASIATISKSKESPATLSNLPLCNPSNRGNDFLTKKIKEYCVANPSFYKK